MKTASRSSTTFVLIVVLLDTMGIGLVIPVGPRLVAEVMNIELGAASPYFGALMGVYSVMQFLFAPVLGGLSDRFGRRAVILPSVMGAAISYLLSALAPMIGWLFVGRIIAGITGASFSAASAYIADVTPPEKRAQSFGLVGAMFGLGFIIGPVLGGVLGNIDVRLPFWVAAALNFVNLIYGLLVLPESLRREDRRPFSLRRSNPFGALRTLASSPTILGLTGTIALGYLATMIMQSVWAISYPMRFGWTPFEVGASLMAAGLATVVAQGALIRPLMPRFGERRVLITALMLSVVSFVGFGAAEQGWQIYALIAVFALGGLEGPAIQSLITREVGPSEQGELQGSLASLLSLTTIVGAPLGTQLVNWFGKADSVPQVVGAPFFAAALCNVLGLVLALRLFARIPSRAAPAAAS